MDPSAGLENKLAEMSAERGGRSGVSMNDILALGDWHVQSGNLSISPLAFPQLPVLILGNSTVHVEFFGRH